MTGFAGLKVDPRPVLLAGDLQIARGLDWFHMNQEADGLWLTECRVFRYFS